MNSSTYKPPCAKRVLRRLYLESGMTFREVATELRCSVKAIQTAMRRFGIEARPARKREQRASANSSWRGSAAGYQALHLRVAKARGKPNKCDECGTTAGRKYEWANLTGRYDDVADYRRMCIPCHRKFDNARRL